MGISRHPLSNPPPGWANVPVDRATIDRLRTSFAAVAADGTRVTAIFYAKLFDRYPGVRSLFPTDMRAQEAKLLDSLRVVIDHLESPETVRPKLVELGARHATYGAKPEHYPIVCELLVETLGEVGGKHWSAQVAGDWVQTLELVSLAMLEGVPRPENGRGATSTRGPTKGHTLAPTHPTSTPRSEHGP